MEGSAAAMSGGVASASRAIVAAAAAAPAPALSPRSMSAERLAQEKARLADDLPQHCHAEPIRGSDFVWSFKIAGLHGSLYQVRVLCWLASCVGLEAAIVDKLFQMVVLFFLGERRDRTIYLDKGSSRGNPLLL